MADLFISLVNPSAQIEINTLGLMVADVFQYQASVNKGLKAVLVMNKCDTHPSDIDASSFRKDIEADQENWIPLPGSVFINVNPITVPTMKGYLYMSSMTAKGTRRGEIEMLLRA